MWVRTPAAEVALSSGTQHSKCPDLHICTCLSNMLSMCFACAVLACCWAPMTSPALALVQRDGTCMPQVARTSMSEKSVRAGPQLGRRVYTWSKRSGSIQALKANSSVTGPTTMLRHHCMRAMQSQQTDDPPPCSLVIQQVRRSRVSNPKTAPGLSV